MAAVVDILVGPRSSLPSLELARAIGEEATALGASAQIVRELARTPDTPTLVVSPHEVFGGTPDETEAVADVLRRSILLTLAHPSTPEWQATLPFVPDAAAIFHVSDAGIAAFKRMGRRSRRFPLGYHHSFDHWRETDAEREIDVAFLGVLSPRRDRLLAELAHVLAPVSTAIYVPERAAEQEASSVDFIAGDSKLDLLARSRLIVDLHVDSEPAFGWLRAVQAICNGCVLLTEAVHDHSPLQRDLHFLSSAVGDLPQALADALRHPDRTAELRLDAYRFLRQELPLRSSVEALLDVAQDLPRLSTRRRRQSRPATTTSESGLSQPKPPAPDAQRDELVEAITKQSAVLKKLFLDLRLLRRQVAQIAHVISEPERPIVESSCTPGVRSDGPELDVSVIVTVHNYARFVRAALESALASEGVELELIVIDDASTDGSVDAVRAVMAEHADDAITLIEQRVNSGVQRARNLAFATARAPLGFVLDADNLVFPDGIAKLRRALDQDPAAGYAYGLIERFGEDRSLGLMNTHAWDAARLAEEHFIDAMALVRIDGLKEAGGYVTDPSLELGWEDYDLWLSFAMAGMHGAHVREFVGRYRAHGVSSLTVTTLDVETLKAKLQERHAAFFAAAGSMPRR